MNPRLFSWEMNSLSDRKIIVQITFNSKALKHNKNQRFTKEWIDERMVIFMKFTLQSLKKQSNQDFITLVRYAEETEQLIVQALKRYGELPSNIEFVREADYENRITELIKDYRHLYLARIDSDDMYHQSFIQQLHDCQHKETTIALINQNGYLYDSIKECLSPIHFSSPPFHTLIYRTEEYSAGKRYPLRSHTAAIEYPHEFFPHRNYCIVIHSTNTTSHFRIKGKNHLSPPKTKQILSEFMNL